MVPVPREPTQAYKLTRVCNLAGGPRSPPISADRGPRTGADLNHISLLV
jgi:hypothetical protein